MTGLWQTLARLFEAKDEDRLRGDLHTYMTRRYGEHAADQAMDLLKRVGPGPFAREIESQYFDSKINSIAQALAKQAPTEPRRGPGRPPGSKNAPKASTRTTTTEPGQSTDKGSGESEPIPQRPDRVGSQGNVPVRQNVSVRPGEKPEQDPGTAGQNRPQPQPSQQIQPSTLPKDLAALRARLAKVKNVPGKEAEVAALDAKIQQLGRGGESELARRQKQVDYVTLTYGYAAGDKMAAKLGVPTSRERGGELGREVSADHSGARSGEWKKDVNQAGEVTRTYRPRILDPDAMARHTDADAPGRGDASSWDASAEKDLPGGGGVASLRKTGGASGTTRPPAPSRGNRAAKMRDISGKVVDRDAVGANGTVKPRVRDEETGEMLIRRGDNPWQKWQPAGVSQQKQTMRPDQATGDYIRGTRFTNPAQEGQPLFWDPDAEDWVTKSAALAARAQKSAASGG